MPVPPDFSSRPLRVEFVQASKLLRIFKTPPLAAFNPLFFSKNARYRFDAPAISGPAFGTTYAAFDLPTCFAETITREANRKPLTYGGIEVNEALEIKPRYVADLDSVTPLRLADVTDVSLYRLGAEAGEFNSVDYKTCTQPWALELHKRTENVDGLLYRSRFLNNRLAVVIFERGAVRASVKPKNTIPLESHSDYARTLSDLNVYLS